MRKSESHPTLGEVYDGNGNDSEPVPLWDANARRLFDKHSGCGYAIISPSHIFDVGSKMLEFEIDIIKNVNAKSLRNLVLDVQKLRQSYTLLYGGFIDGIGTDKEKNVYERSLIIYNEKRDGSMDLPKGFLDIAVTECSKFSQKFVLVKLPKENARYYTQDGSVKYEFAKDTPFIDIIRQYLTDIHAANEGVASSSFTESYIAPIPQCYSESHVRALKGEKFLLK